jgi:hypothetical protein
MNAPFTPTARDIAAELAPIVGMHDAQHAFLNMLRSLHNIDGYQLPELNWGQQLDFVQTPVKYFIQADEEQQAAIWREISKRQFPKPQRREGKEPCGECRLPVGEVCDICGASA